MQITRTLFRTLSGDSRCFMFFRDNSCPFRWGCRQTGALLLRGNQLHGGWCYQDEFTVQEVHLHGQLHWTGRTRLQRRTLCHGRTTQLCAHLRRRLLLSRRLALSWVPFLFYFLLLSSSPDLEVSQMAQKRRWGTLKKSKALVLDWNPETIVLGLEFWLSQ